jgi:hypothetical protein
MYCRQDASTSRGVPHVFPEAFGKNAVVLPIGSVCDACNSYLGHELDSVFIAHPVVSMIAQTLRLPGKSGKLRKHVGNVEIDVFPRSITIPTEEPKIIVHPDGTRSSTAAALVDPQFDLLRFRRALHHIAFNAYALRRGKDEVLAARFDPVRKYIRSPHKGEAWPFVQFCDLERGFGQDVTLVLDDDESIEAVSITLCGAIAFGVGLLDSGRLQEWAYREFPQDTVTFGPDYHIPRSRRQSRIEGRYDLTIFLDE